MNKQMLNAYEAIGKLTELDMKTMSEAETKFFDALCYTCISIFRDARHGISNPLDGEDIKRAQP